jgi:hypothetical protein
VGIEQGAILEALNRKRNDVTAYLKKHFCGKFFGSIVPCLNLPFLGSQTVTPILLSECKKHFLFQYYHLAFVDEEVTNTMTSSFL